MSTPSVHSGAACPGSRYYNNQLLPPLRGTFRGPAGPFNGGLPARSTGACRPVLTENSPPDCFPGVRTTENSPPDCFPGVRTTENVHWTFFRALEPLKNVHWTFFWRSVPQGGRLRKRPKGFLIEGAGTRSVTEGVDPADRRPRNSFPELFLHPVRKNGADYSMSKRTFLRHTLQTGNSARARPAVAPPHSDGLRRYAAFPWGSAIEK